MTFREQMMENGENLSWCKPFVSERVSFAMNEGKIETIIIDGEEIDDPTEDDIANAAKIVNPNYDDYDGWHTTHILLEGDIREVGCAECPWFDRCDAMDGEVEE